MTDLSVEIPERENTREARAARSMSQSATPTASSSTSTRTDAACSLGTARLFVACREGMIIEGDLAEGGAKARAVTRRDVVRT